MTETSSESKKQLSQEELLKKYRLFIPDRPIEDFEKDKFDHQHFVEVLNRLIEKFDPPFNIGLFGKWGTGKSSISLMLKKEIGKLVPPKATKEPVITSMVFNAWRYPKKSLRRKLLIDVADKFGADRNEIHKRLTVEQRVSKTKKSALGWFIAAGVAVLVIVGSQLFLRNYSLPWAATFSFLGVAIAATSAVLAFLANSLPEAQTTLVVGKPQTTEEFETLMEQLLVDKPLAPDIKKRFFNGKDRANIKPLVVFVDDLDRCNEHEILETLEAMKAFLECTDKTIFIVAADDEVIKDAVREQLGPEEGEDYLDKLFQISLRIPPFEEFDFRQYAKDLIEMEVKGRRHLMYLLKEQNSEVYDKVLYNLIPHSVNNPRSVKKLINTFSLLLVVARKRNVELVLNNLPLLAKTTALQVEFPWFYEMLHESHMLLGKMKRFVVGRNEKLLDADEIKMLKPHMNQQNRLHSSQAHKTKYIPPADDLFTYLSDSAGEWDNIDLRPFLYLKSTHYGDTTADRFLRTVEQAALTGRSDIVLEKTKEVPRRIGEILGLLLDTFRKVQEYRKERVVEGVIRLTGDEEVLSLLSKHEQKFSRLAQRIGTDLAHLLTDKEKILKYPVKSILRIITYAHEPDGEEAVDHYLSFIEKHDEEISEEELWDVGDALVDYDLTSSQRKRLVKYLLTIGAMGQEVQQKVLLKVCSVPKEIREGVFTVEFLDKLIKIAIEPLESEKEEEETEEETG